MKLDVETLWYRSSLHPLMILLLPFSGLFRVCVAIRRWFYRIGLLKTYRATAPVIVVGNLTVGGTGKTPFVIWLVNFLRSQGYHPGIVSRGVGGKKHYHPHCVTHDDEASLVGDEALLLLQNAGCPVVIGMDRAAAVSELLKYAVCDIVISDDGLQHYRMGRDIEIILVDGERNLGNQQLLPAGPLREPVSRLQTVDMVVINGGSESDVCTMSLKPVEFVSVSHPETIMSFEAFPRQKVNAMAGIGHPQRFFSVLSNAGFDVSSHVFPDHHAYASSELNFAESWPILMTEKDAVKCKAFADQRYWFLRVEPVMSSAVEEKILLKLSTLKKVNNHADKKHIAMCNSSNSRSDQSHDTCVNK
jgi:tetraacyldisaccharide 4'-kinase